MNCDIFLGNNADYRQEIFTKERERNMEKSNQKGKLLIFLIIVSSIIFLILHNNELYFQEYGNRILLNLFRVSIFAPLLYFLYKKHNWARYTLAIISSILLIVGMIGIPLVAKDWIKQSDLIYLGSMMACMLFNAIVLFFSKDVISYVKSR
ncbi:MAG: hypothetical protein AB1656_22135 [Candidatus Omnitrophota bacterium]